MSTAVTRFRCLELVPLRWATEDGEYCDYAVLHEIGPKAGLFQVDRAAPVGTPVTVTLPRGDTAGVVRACMPEDSGYILEIDIERAQDWLEGSFRPSVLAPLQRASSFQLRLAS